MRNKYKEVILMTEELGVNRDGVGGIFGSFGDDSSLLFFFLILVVIFKNCGMFNGNDDSLLFFFLLLVLLFCGEGFCF